MLLFPVVYSSRGISGEKHLVALKDQIERHVPTPGFSMLSCSYHINLSILLWSSLATIHFAQNCMQHVLPIQLSLSYFYCKYVYIRLYKYTVCFSIVTSWQVQFADFLVVLKAAIFSPSVLPFLWSLWRTHVFKNLQKHLAWISLDSKNWFLVNIEATFGVLLSSLPMLVKSF